MSFRNAIRKRLFDLRDIGELARDVQNVFDRIPSVDTRDFVDLYRAGMMLGKVPKEPTEIRMARVLLASSPETVVTPGHVHFTYLGADEGARINEIAGLTEGTRYRFVFVVTYA